MSIIMLIFCQSVQASLYNICPPRPQLEPFLACKDTVSVLRRSSLGTTLHKRSGENGDGQPISAFSRLIYPSADIRGADIRGSHLHISLSANPRVLFGFTTSVRPTRAGNQFCRTFIRGVYLGVLCRMRAEQQGASDL